MKYSANTINSLIKISPFQKQKKLELLRLQFTILMSSYVFHLFEILIIGINLL